MSRSVWLQAWRMIGMGCVRLAARHRRGAAGALQAWTAGAAQAAGPEAACLGRLAGHSQLEERFVC